MTLHESAISLGLELCGSVEKLQELLISKKEGTIKSEYWQAICDAIMAQNRINEHAISEGENVNTITKRR